MSLVSIAYVSAAAQPMAQHDIDALLATSRSNNARDGITGALLYHGGRFAQILEGPELVLRARVRVISTDERHRHVQVMRDRRIPERQFPQWTMGFESPTGDAARELEGFEDIFGRRGADRLAHADNEAQQFLEWLAEYWLPRR